MKKYDLKANNLILSVLRAADQPAVSIRDLVAIGELFGFTGNTVRVTVTRLIRRGVIESDERGFYRFSASGDFVSRHFETWRDGEDRIVPWDGSWICCLLPKPGSKTGVRDVKAFGFLGFKEGKPGLWVRPSNLAIGLNGVITLLEKMGLEPGAEFFNARCFRENLEEQWRRFLWPLDQLTESANSILEKIERSKKNLLEKPLENAVVESYLIGSDAVHRLIMDPLLPPEIFDSTARSELTTAMLEYDEIGVKVWMRMFGDLKMGCAPSHLRLAK